MSSGGVQPKANAGVEPNLFPLAEILEMEFGELRIGDRDQRAVQRPYARGSYANLLDLAKHVAKLHHFPEPHRFIGKEGHPSDEIFHRRLGR